MAFTIPYPLVNGHRYSWASIEVRIGTAVIVGFKGVTYEHTLEPVDVYGTSPKKIGRTRGKDNSTGSFEMYRLEFENLKLALGGVGYKEVPFDIVVSFADLNQPVITDTLIGCRITKSTYSNSEGADPSTVSCDLNLMELLENGVTGTSPVPQVAPTGGV